MAWVRRELKAIGIPPLRRFGQNFLIDTKVREELVKSGELTANDVVLEVGPGLGFLTSALAEKAAANFSFWSRVHKRHCTARNSFGNVKSLLRNLET